MSKIECLPNQKMVFFYVAYVFVCVYLCVVKVHKSYLSI